MYKRGVKKGDKKVRSIEFSSFYILKSGFLRKIESLYSIYFEHFLKNSIHNYTILYYIFCITFTYCIAVWCGYRW